MITRNRDGLPGRGTPNDDVYLFHHKQ